MTTTHVLIVSERTMKLHLEYLFIGTGGKKTLIDFNQSATTNLHHSTERNLVAMIADINRIRKDDKIIFYVQKGQQEGTFYGIFKVTSEAPFIDDNDDRQYLKNELDKLLPFRALIKPHEVYARGVTEWQALDEIKNIHSPNQMLWSLIYRKLKANRGCTMITLYESERLCQLIRDHNMKKSLNVNNGMLSFDDNKIVCKSSKANAYKGRQVAVDIMRRLIAKLKDGKAFEGHLQAYITQNIGTGRDRVLDEIILTAGEQEWIGNEVSCGVGMQRIDVLLSLTKNDQRVVVPIELKDEKINPDTIYQMQRYIYWLEQYYIPNIQGDIQPVLISRAIEDKTSASYKEIIQSFDVFNTSNNSSCLKLKYIEFCEQQNQLIFNNITY